MNINELKRRFPGASESFIEKNKDKGNASDTKPEQIIQHQLERQIQGKKENSRRVLISFETCRRRLLDEDDLCAKFFTDCLRYAGIIHGDSAKEATIEKPVQRLCKKGEKEHTIVTIEFL